MIVAVVGTTPKFQAVDSITLIENEITYSSVSSSIVIGLV
jgi:hypothetical protein